ncbi:MAG: hypothetical protein ACXVZQ_01025 [Terriglobales bacterium]
MGKEVAMGESENIRRIIDRVVSASLATHVAALKEELVEKACQELEAIAAETAPAAALAPTAPSGASTELLNAAINSVRDSTTQVDILMSLLEGVSKFADRTALFVIRAGVATGWRAIGLENKDSIKALSLDLNEGLVARAYRDRMPASGSAAEFDTQFVSTYGAPAEGTNVMVLPLVIRDKVAALVYADAGFRLDGNLDPSAVETVVHCAGMWLEIMAARKGGATRADGSDTDRHIAKYAEPAPAPEPTPEPAYEPSAAVYEPAAPAYEPAAAVYEPAAPAYEPAPAAYQPAAAAHETPVPWYEKPSPEPVEPMYADAQPAMAPESVFGGGTAAVAAAAEPEHVPPGLETSTIAIPSNLSPDEEEIHRKAKRFAKLLVDEIKLYNQAKVAEGRMQRNLYQRLRDDIDKSRATYDKRYGSTAAASANYFTRELVRILANDDPSLLGSGFTG